MDKITYDLSKVDLIKHWKVTHFVEDCPFQTQEIVNNTDCIIFLLAF